jgi:hypothetical protein
MTNFDTLVHCAIEQNIASFALRDEGRWDDVRDLFHPSLHFWLAYRIARFARFPAEYRHLAFGLKRQGLRLADRIVVAHSREDAALKAASADWLANP